MEWEVQTRDEERLGSLCPWRLSFGIYLISCRMTYKKNRGRLTTGAVCDCGVLRKRTAGLKNHEDNRTQTWHMSLVCGVGNVVDLPKICFLEES